LSFWQAAGAKASDEAIHLSACEDEKWIASLRLHDEVAALAAPRLAR
jgi:hypothetical protein